MLYLFNTNIIPSEALVRVSKISTEKAIEIVTSSEEVTSAIGHQGSVDALSALGIETSVNRIMADPKPFDKAISIKLNGRLEEGKILDKAAMDSMGYSLFLLEFYPTNWVIAPTAEYHSNSMYF